MERLIKVEFVEQSKCVTANVKVEYSNATESDKEKILAEAKELFNDAQKFAIVKSMQKA